MIGSSCAHRFTHFESSAARFSNSALKSSDDQRVVSVLSVRAFDNFLANSDWPSDLSPAHSESLADKD